MSSSSLLKAFIHNTLHNAVEWPQLEYLLEQWFDRHYKSWHQLNDLLPTLVCEAAGGSAESSLPLSAAWTLFFFASKIFDNIQDDEGHEEAWMCAGIPQAVSYGLTLIGIASEILESVGAGETHKEITRAFGRNFALAAKTQATSTNDLDIEGYFTTIIGSTANLCATAAWAGARLATDEFQLLNACHEYGLNAGIGFAIINDCCGVEKDILRGTYKLPLIHALSQQPRAQQRSWHKILANPPLDQQHLTALLDLIETANSRQWCLQIARQYQAQAVQTIQSVDLIHIESLVAYARQEAL